MDSQALIETLKKLLANGTTEFELMSATMAVCEVKHAAGPVGKSIVVVLGLSDDSAITTMKFNGDTGAYESEERTASVAESTERTSTLP